MTGLALALAVLAGAAAPASPPAPEAPLAAQAAPPPAKARPVAARIADPCDRLDAENLPRCLDRRAGPPGLATPPRAGAIPRAPAAAGPVKKPAAKPKAVPASTPFLRQLFMESPLLVGGGAGVLVLALAGGGLFLLGRPRAPTPRATPPTPLRRDLVLRAAGGRSWRIPGAALTPGAHAGSDPRGACHLAFPGIERRHVVFWVSDGRLLARKASRAPVFLNDRLLSQSSPEIVSTGDRLRLGEMEFEIVID